MNRRKFLAQAAGVVEAALCQGSFASGLGSLAGEPAVRIQLDTAQTLAIIPPNFMGLGYEISYLARPGVLSSQNTVYLHLVRTLGKQGVIRVGGNTSDYASYDAAG